MNKSLFFYVVYTIKAKIFHQLVFHNKIYQTHLFIYELTTKPVEFNFTYISLGNVYNLFHISAVDLNHTIKTQPSKYTSCFFLLNYLNINGKRHGILM